MQCLKTPGYWRIGSIISLLYIYYIQSINAGAPLRQLHAGITPTPRISGIFRFECPEGFQLVDSVCIKFETLDPKITCPYGSWANKDETECIAKDALPPEKLCPAGFTPLKTGCIKKIEIQAIPICPEGTTLESNGNRKICVKDNTRDKVKFCKRGTLKDDKCIEYKIITPAHKCQENSTFSKGRCKRIIQQKPKYECDQGYALVESDNSKCQVWIEAEPKTLCPKGFNLMNKECVKYEEAEIGCPENYTLSSDSKQCGRLNADAAIPICRHGWLYDAKKRKCIKEEEPTYVCKNQADKNACVKWETRLPERKCGGGELVKSKGNHMFDKHYTKMDGYLCKVTPNQSYVCPIEGFVLRPDKNNHKVCQKQYMKNSQIKCPSDTTFVDSKCVGEIIIDPDYTCPPGTFLNGQKQCIQEMFSEAESKCPQGFNTMIHDHEEQCIFKETTIPTYECPSGFTMQNSLVQTPRQVILGNAPRLEKSYSERGICEKTEKTYVQLICPVNYTIKRNRRGDVESCVAEKIIPGTKVCEPGFFLKNNTCIKHVKAPPLAINDQGNAFPCIFGSNGSPSCGNKVDWPVRMNT